MKQLLLLSCLLLIAIKSNAQDGIMPFTPHLQNKTFNDLEDFKGKVKNARIIFLGDIIHGEANIDAARIYIIKMLIEELGFEVLAFESGIYDLYKAELLHLNEGLSYSQALKENIFYIWTGFESFKPLLEYLELKKDKVKIVGFDPQFSTDLYGAEIGEDLDEFLKKCKVEYDGSVIEDWMFTVQDLVDFYQSDKFNKIYFNLLNKKLIGYLNQASKKSEYAEEAAIWKQIIESKKQLARFFIEEGVLEKDATTFKAVDANTRDKSMADNLQFYLDLYPDKKFICWGASTHFAKSTQNIENEELNEFKPMGSYIKEKYGDKAVVIGATGYKGQYGWAEELHDMPEAAENSLETMLYKTGHKNALVDLTQFKDNMPLLSSTFVEEGYQLNGHWDKVFDWFLFVDEVYPKTIESATNLSEKKVTEESKEALEEGFDFMLPEDRYKVLIMSRKGESISGTILDKHKNPIPFAAVGLKGKSYGTITDENGNFSLLIPAISKKDSLVFSNVAYQSKTVAVGDLQSSDSKIMLEDKVIALPELIISSKNNTAEGIIIAAINRIEDNYYQDPFSFKILYHTIKKDTANEKVFNIDWTALNYFEKGYQSERGHGPKGFYSGEGSRVGAYNLENKKTEKYSKHEPSWREFVGLWLHDFVKYRRNNFLNKRNLRHYDFKIAATFQENGNTICQIDFKCTKINSKTVQYYFVRNFNGSLFIDLDDYAIIKIKTEALIDKEKILKRPKWDLENLDSTWVMKKEVDYKKAEKYYFIHHTEYYDNYSLNAFADIYYFDFELKERPIEANNHTYEQVKFSDNDYWKGIFDKIKE